MSLGFSAPFETDPMVLIAARPGKMLNYFQKAGKYYRADAGPDTDAQSRQPEAHRPNL